ncbi:MAG: hypothetical protein JJ899_10120 [Alphaproteobacteria bacterium]|nr:hypothetical protein [Alphaproteobacteria bacterium]
MSAPERDLVAGFLDGLARERVVEFIRDVAQTEELMVEVGQAALTPASITAVANRLGYAFDASDLVDTIEARIASRIDAGELEIRDRMRAARDADGPAGLTPMDADTDATLHDVVHRPGFVLDREAVLSGDVLALRALPSLPPLLAIMDEVIGARFDGVDLERLHEGFDFAAMKARSDAAYDALYGDPRVPDAVGAIIADLGLDRSRTLWEWPGMRLMFPAEHGGRGVYRTANSGALAAHRDTWYGSPRHQINLWGPIRRLDPDATLRIYPRYFRKTVANTSRGYDAWQNRAGIALPPTIRASVSAEGAFAPPLEIGDVMVFAGQQLHASAVNMSGRTRVSFEFRLLCADDEGQSYVPPNVDYAGLGEIYEGWHDADGREWNRLTGERVCV